jgi:hypothetical protein
MTYTQTTEIALTGGKSGYTSAILNNKFTELTNSGDLTMSEETLSNGNKKFIQVWKDETTFNSFLSWLLSSGEGAKMEAYRIANNITYINS